MPLTAAAGSFLPHLKMKTWKKPIIRSNRSAQLLKALIMKSRLPANRQLEGWRKTFPVMAGNYG